MKGASVSFFISFVLIANLQNAESIKMSLEEIRTALQPISKVCIERVGVNPKLIDDASNNNFVPDRKLQCYFKCMLLMTKVMKKDVIVERALFNIAELMLNEELVTPVMNGIKHCHPIISQSKEGCELAYESIKCFYEFDEALRYFT